MKAMCADINDASQSEYECFCGVILVCKTVLPGFLKSVM